MSLRYNRRKVSSFHAMRVLKHRITSLIIAASVLCMVAACQCRADEGAMRVSITDTPQMTARNQDQTISCRLTPKELQTRKETVIASLKRKVLEKKELPNGFAYRFPGDDAVVDELVDFVKSERSCCSFFTFGLSFSGDGSEAWLNLTGPNGAKEMIQTELGL